MISLNYGMPWLNKRSYGDYSSGVHLFPFRTESLSPLAQMVLQSLWESMSSPNFYKNPASTLGFFLPLPHPLFPYLCQTNQYR